MYQVIYMDGDYTACCEFKNRDVAVSLAKELMEESGVSIILHGKEVIFFE